MAIYRCPKCWEIVPQEDARRCMNCGTVFNMDHEPVLDDGSGKPEHVRKKEKRLRTIAIAGLAVFLAIIIAVIIVNTREVHDKVNYWNEKSKVGAVDLP